MKLTVLFAFIICFVMSFAFNSAKTEEPKDTQIQKLCNDFCDSVGCTMFEYRHGGCSCRTPENNIMQGDIITLDIPGKPTYVTNVKTID